MALFLIMSSSSITTVFSLRILGLFPHPGLSHFHFFHPIMRSLADAGHDVTVISHFPDKQSPAPENYHDLRLPTTESLSNSVDLKVIPTYFNKINNKLALSRMNFCLFAINQFRCSHIACRCSIFWNFSKSLNGVRMHVSLHWALQLYRSS